jgi:4-amino-4-deoxy-L-arabinose transferase-like glycosyltransferase
MKKINWLLVGIILLAGVLRLVRLNQSPPSLYWEEAALGYDAYSILKTGKDYHGNPWPLVAFESFGDWKPSGYFYALVPFVAVLGLNDWAVRLPSAIAGIVTVWLVYLIAGEMTNKKATALWAAFLLAIMPWHIQFSRAAFEVNLATFLLTLGVYFLLKARTRPRWLMGAAVCMVGSMYTYHGLRVLAPLMAAMMFLRFFHKYIKQKLLWISILVGLILTMPIIKAWNSPQIQQRINETSLFSTSTGVLESNEAIKADGKPLWAKIIHHRYLYWTKEILSSSLAQISPNFLFLTGDGNDRHQTGKWALLFWWMIIPLLYGVSEIGFRQKQYWWLLGWILLATIPPALTNLTPHTLRFLPAAPAFALIMAIGMNTIFPKLQKFKLAVLSLMMMLLAGYFYDLCLVYPKRVSQDWQWGYKQVMEKIKPFYLEGQSIYMTNAYGRASIYAMFYWKLDPDSLQKNEFIAQKDQGELLQINNLHINDYYPGSGILVSNKPQNMKLIDQVNFLDGVPAFYVYNQ